MSTDHLDKRLKELNFEPWGVHCENISKQRAGKYRVIYIHKRKT